MLTDTVLPDIRDTAIKLSEDLTQHPEKIEQAKKALQESMGSAPLLWDLLKKWITSRKPQVLIEQDNEIKLLRHAEMSDNLMTLAAGVILKRPWNIDIEIMKRLIRPCVGYSENTQAKTLLYMYANITEFCPEWDKLTNSHRDTRRIDHNLAGEYTNRYSKNITFCYKHVLRNLMEDRVSYTSNDKLHDIINETLNIILTGAQSYSSLDKHKNKLSSDKFYSISRRIINKHHGKTKTITWTNISLMYKFIEDIHSAGIDRLLTSAAYYAKPFPQEQIFECFQRMHQPIRSFDCGEGLNTTLNCLFDHINEEHGGTFNYPPHHPPANAPELFTYFIPKVGKRLSPSHIRTIAQFMIEGATKEDEWDINRAARYLAPLEKLLEIRPLYAAETIIQEIYSPYLGKEIKANDPVNYVLKFALECLDSHDMPCGKKCNGSPAIAKAREQIKVASLSNHGLNVQLYSPPKNQTIRKSLSLTLVPKLQQP